MMATLWFLYLLTRFYSADFPRDLLFYKAICVVVVCVKQFRNWRSHCSSLEWISLIIICIVFARILRRSKDSKVFFLQLSSCGQPERGFCYWYLSWLTDYMPSMFCGLQNIVLDQPWKPCKTNYFPLTIDGNNN